MTAAFVQAGANEQLSGALSWANIMASNITPGNTLVAFVSSGTSQRLAPWPLTPVNGWTLVGGNQAAAAAEIEVFVRTAVSGDNKSPPEVYTAGSFSSFNYTTTIIELSGVGAINLETTNGAMLSPNDTANTTSLSAGSSDIFAFCYMHLYDATLLNFEANGSGGSNTPGDWTQAQNQQTFTQTATGVSSSGYQTISGSGPVVATIAAGFSGFSGIGVDAAVILFQAPGAAGETATGLMHFGGIGINAAAIETTGPIAAVALHLGSVKIAAFAEIPGAAGTGVVQFWTF